MTNKAREVIVLENLEQMTEVAVDAFKKIAKQAIKERGRFMLAFSGGKTPVNFYQKLAQNKKCSIWDNTHLFLSDERFVPLQNSASNFHLIKSTLLDKLCFNHFHAYPVEVAAETSSIAAKKYEEKIREIFHLKENELPEFDLIMLGMGADGHTASLFPNDSSLNEKRHLTCAVSNDQHEHERITLTLPVINRARNVIFLIEGAKKAEAVKVVIEGQNLNYPASLVKPSLGQVVFLIDTAAGGLLSNKGGE